MRASFSAYPPHSGRFWYINELGVQWNGQAPIIEEITLLLFPNSKMTESSSLAFNLLPAEIRQSSTIGAEIQLPSRMDILDLDRLTEEDKNSLRQALFENQVIVIRNQKGIDPTVLPKLAKVFDPNASNIHSAGDKAVSDPKNILSAYKAGRIPKAPQVGIIGSGTFRDYEGLDELEVVHLVFAPRIVGQWHFTYS